MGNQTEQPHILILNQMAGPITWELAEDIANTLGQVALLTGHPDTLQKSHPNIQMSPATPYDRANFPRRIISWVRYWIQAFFWLWRWPKDTPILLFSNPPFLCWLGWFANVLRGTPFTVMVHDIYPDVLVKMGGFNENRPIIGLWQRLNGRAYERATAVMTLGEYMAQTLGAQFDASKTPHGSIEVIYLWVDVNKIKPIPKHENWFAEKHNQIDKLTVMYSGNMGLGHDIETMIEAAATLKDQSDIHFMFIGSGPKWQIVEHVKQEKKLENVTLLGWQPEESFPYALSTADLAFVSLEEEMQGLAIPSKAIYSMAAGSAILAITQPKCELGEWVNLYDCGAVTPPGDVNELVQQILTYRNPEKLHAHKANARRTAEERYSRQNTQQLIQLAK